jgi:hypothetical protein
MSAEQTILFGPRNGKSLLRTYPELASDQVFKEISSDELLFAWYMGIPGSPIDEELSIGLRLKAAASRAFPNNIDKYKKYSAGDVPDSVKAAWRKFEEYNPEARLAAKKMVQTIFSKWQEIIGADVKKDFIYTDKDGNEAVDWTARKQYVDATKTISESLPSVIKQLEEGFGYQEIKKTEQGMKAIDKYHQEKKQ